MRQKIFMALFLALVCLVFSTALLALILPADISAAPNLLRERIAIEASEDSYINGGSDIIWYTGQRNNETARVDGTDGQINTDFGLTISPRTYITATNGGVITPTGMYQPVAAAGDVTSTVSGCGDAGSILILINTSDTSIIISETATIVMGGNQTLGQYDSLTFWGDGTRCIQIAEMDN